MSVILTKLRAKLVLIHDAPAMILDPKVPPIWVSFAFVERETEGLILPESLLDDWGREISSFALYQWVYENGEQFPRAEIFGRRPTGEHVQRFLREFDLTAAFRCFAKIKSEQPIESMSLVDMVLVRNESSRAAERVSPPNNTPYPLSQIKADWWTIPEGGLSNFKQITSQSVGLNN